jgi:hypothetical protein
VKIELNELQMVMRLLDNDKDGKISLPEFLFEYSKKNQKPHEIPNQKKNDQPEKIPTNEQNNKNKVDEKSNNLQKEEPKEEKPKEEPKKEIKQEENGINKETAKKSSLKKQSVAQNDAKKNEPIVFEDPEDASRLSFLEYKTIKVGPSDSPELKQSQERKDQNKKEEEKEKEKNESEESVSNPEEKKEI